MMKDKETHKSKGVAFVMFLERDALHSAVKSLNNTKVYQSLYHIYHQFIVRYLLGLDFLFIRFLFQEC